MSVTLQEAIQRQQRACTDLGFPFYPVILEGCLADLDASGPVGEVFAGRARVRAGDLVPLRFLGGVHRLVLERRAPELALHFPSVGGDGDAHAAWPAFRRAVAQNVDDLVASLESPPQTNDVGRSMLLAGALAHVLEPGPMPVRLFELGASAGLNLLIDRFGFAGARGTWGPSDTELVMSGRGLDEVEWPAEPLRIIERGGCDPRPIDPTTTDGRLGLTAFVWPDDRVRHQRLSAALRIAQRNPAPVVEADALDYVRTLHPVAGTLTVIWHSVALMYIPRDRRDEVDAAIEALGRSADAEAPVVAIGFEPDRIDTTEFPLRVRRWPEGTDTVLATASPHGAEVRWAS